MIDRGLFLSVVVVAAVVYIGARAARPHTMAPNHVFDVLMGPAMVGLLVGRLTAMALTDLGSFTEVRDVLVLRGGVEFWPALAAALVVLWRSARRSGADPLLRLVDLLPYVLWAMAGYELTCLLREGCFGPLSPIGIVPTGLHRRVLPLGILVAASTTAVGVAIRRRWPVRPLTTALLALTFVAGQRALISFWLPRFGDGLTRQHLQSVAVAAVSAFALVGVSAWSGEPPGVAKDSTTDHP